MKKVVILIVILLMLFFILACFANGEEGSPGKRVVKNNMAAWHEYCHTNFCKGGDQWT
jgi:hypothetical protein